ncbi:hypothetical protein B0J17DRAFT_631950 [Rhizoctonia solani]|nr:hypothetical protein B0J17DRAFT_631950 [Rhizoctonia solani]
MSVPPWGASPDHRPSLRTAGPAVAYQHPKYGQSERANISEGGRGYDLRHAFGLAGRLMGPANCWEFWRVVTRVMHELPATCSSMEDATAGTERNNLSPAESLRGGRAQKLGLEGVRATVIHSQPWKTGSRISMIVTHISVEKMIYLWLRGSNPVAYTENTGRGGSKFTRN